MVVVVGLLLGVLESIINPISARGLNTPEARSPLEGPAEPEQALEGSTEDSAEGWMLVGEEEDI